MVMNSNQELVQMITRIDTRLENITKRMNYLVEYIEDSKLSEDDKLTIKQALKEEKEGKLLSKKQVFN